MNERGVKLIHQGLKNKSPVDGLDKNMNVPQNLVCLLVLSN